MATRGVLLLLRPAAPRRLRHIVTVGAPQRRVGGHHGAQNRLFATTSSKPKPPPSEALAAEISSKGMPVAVGMAYMAVVTGGYFLGAELGFFPKPFPDLSELLVVPEAGLVTERVFLDVAIDNVKTGRVVLGLYGGTCPKTVRNFSALCASTSPVLGYKNMPFHRVVPGFMAQSGDFTIGDGTGGNSIYGGKFPDENFEHKHTGAGVLAMANKGEDTNTSQFYVTYREAPHLDGKHVVFGCVLEGMEVLKKMEARGSRNGKTTQPITVVDCGGLERTREEAENYGRAKYGSTGIVIKKQATQEKQ